MTVPFVRVTLHGAKSSDAAVVAETLSALDGLFREVCREVTGDPDAVRLTLTSFTIECDRCGALRTEDAKGWTKDGADDVCAGCAA